MATPYAALVWGRVLPLETLDTNLILEFFRTEGERTAPEIQCTPPSPSPPPSSPSTSPSTAPSGSPSATPSPAASSPATSESPAATSPSASPS
jgi:hypothetical protein